MQITDDTRREIEAVLDRQIRLPDAYHDLLIRWMAFNRAYSDLVEKGRDYQKVLAIGGRLQEHWGQFEGPAVQLVSLECVGGERVPDSELLRPTRWVKSATLYLRDRLDLQRAADPDGCEFATCRTEKRRLCNDVVREPWEEQDRQEMAALLRLVYQVRCNLVHGDKRLGNEDVQTGRDLELIEISTRVLDQVLPLLLLEA